MKLYIVFTILVAGTAVQLLAADPKAPSAADVAKAAEAAKQKALQQFDLNRDGVLSEQERAAAEQAMWQALPNMPGAMVGSNPFLRQFDRDGDGKLSAPELRLAREAWERSRRNGSAPQRGVTPGGNGGFGGPPAPSSPGTDSKAEKEKEKVSPLVKRFDKNGDGKLSEEEKAAAQAELNKGKKKDKSKDDKGNDKDSKKPAEKAGN